jgi:hypothetical protein
MAAGENASLTSKREQRQEANEPADPPIPPP